MSEPPKTNKHRRSSILKPQKQRNPLDEIEIADFAANTSTKSAKRVSFASSNSVKPFGIDDDKNTIWDNTYEEAVDSTNSTHSSQEQSKHSNHTHVKKEIADDMELTCQEELTKSIDDNYPGEYQTDYVDLDPTMEFTCEFNGKEVLIDVKRIPNCRLQQYLDTCLIKEDIQITEVNQNTLTANSQQNFSTDTMEFTCQVKEQSDDYNDAQSSSDKMELTCQIEKDYLEQCGNKSIITITNLSNSAKEHEHRLKLEVPVNSAMEISIIDDINQGIQTAECEMKKSLRPKTGDDPKTCYEVKEFNDVEHFDKSIKIEDSHLPLQMRSELDFNFSMGNSNMSKVDVCSNVVKEVIKDPLLGNVEPNTPTSSFHLSLPNISVCNDDTEHLINFSNTKPSISKLMMSLDDVSMPSMRNLSNDECDESNVLNNSDNTVSIPKSNKLQSVNDTYHLKNIKTNRKNITEATDFDHSLSYNDKGDAVDEYDYPLVRAFLEEKKKVERHQFSMPKIDYDFTRQLALIKQQEQIANIIKQFHFKSIEIPKLSILDIPIVEENHCITQKNVDGIVETESILQKIETLQKRPKCLWKFEKYDDKFHFSTLFKSLGFIVDVEMNMGRVLSMNTFKRLSDHGRPLSQFILAMFLDKLSIQNIEAALGQIYDIFSLLDYVELTMKNVMRFRQEVDLLGEYGLEFDKDFNATFQMINPAIPVLWIITVNMSNLKNFKPDDIAICARFGKCDENKIKNLANDLPRDITSLKCFIYKVEEYVNLMEKRMRRMKKS